MRFTCNPGRSASARSESRGGGFKSPASQGHATGRAFDNRSAWDREQFKTGGEVRTQVPVTTGGEVAVRHPGWGLAGETRGVVELSTAIQLGEVSPEVRIVLVPQFSTRG